LGGDVCYVMLHRHICTCTHIYRHITYTYIYIYRYRSHRLSTHQGSVDQGVEELTEEEAGEDGGEEGLGRLDDVGEAVVLLLL
jgi:hypothetical protein